MGALTRATIAEVEELHAGDVTWWPGLCGAIAENGSGALYAEKGMRGWAWGALWQWIKADEKRFGDYQSALEAYVQMKALETLPVAENANSENVAVAKLRIDTAFRLAGKVDRARWGDKVEVSQTVAVMDAGLIGFASELLERLRPAEKVVEALGPDEI